MELKGEITIYLDMERVLELGFTMETVQTHFTQALEICLDDYMPDLVLSSLITTMRIPNA